MEVAGSSEQVSGGADRGVRIDVLEARLNEVVGGLNVVYGRLVEVVVKFVSDPDLWEGRGLRSLEHYVCWKANVSRRVACQLTAVARRAGELPETVGALRDGRITLDQADEVARWVPWWGDGQAARLAEVTTVSQLGRTLRRYPFGDYVKPEDLFDDDPEAQPDPETDPDSAEPAGAEDDTSSDESPDSGPSGEREHCRFGHDERGRFFLHLLTDGLTGALIERALEEARDALFESGRRDVTWVRALEEVAQRSLDTVESPSRRDRFKLHFHLDLAGGAVDAANVPIPDCLREYLTCDGSWDPVFTNNGVPLNVGRGDRIVPERLRRIVLLRDGGCCDVPGCGATRSLEIHHIVHWTDEGGVTETWNLVALCPHHHRMHHRGELGICGNADDPNGLAYTHANGRPFTRSGARPVTELDPGELCPPIGTFRPPSGETLYADNVYFNPPWVQRRLRGIYPPPKHHVSRRWWKPRPEAA